jgi:hypothetical protein
MGCSKGGRSKWLRQTVGLGLSGLAQPEFI